MTRVVVTGASGLVGSALVPALRADGHEVTTLVRREPAGDGEVRWDPDAGELDPAALKGADAVVHLAGAGIGDQRWTPAYRERVLASRISGTSLLARLLAETADGPRTLLSASAVGWYGDTGDREVDESDPAGGGFLADVCRAWETATAPAIDAGVRVCHLRSGIVLSTRGGALAKQLPLFRLGLGGRLGSGRQYLSWISIADEVAAIRFLLPAGLGSEGPSRPAASGAAAAPVSSSPDSSSPAPDSPSDGSAPDGSAPDVRSGPGIAGAVNLVAPAPVTNGVFTRALAAAVHRPAVARVPAVALRLALGGFADEGVLAGQRVLPRVLTDAGFVFTHVEVSAALRDVITGGF